MARSIFNDKAIKPTDDSLKGVLGEMISLWKEFRNYLDDEYGNIHEEWKFYGQKSGWILKVIQKKRNLFFFTPLDEYFAIAFVFGDRAVDAVEKSDLPEGIITSLKNARKYMEGRGIQIEVKSPEDIENIKKLVEIKLNN